MKSENANTRKYIHENLLLQMLEYFREPLYVTFHYRNTVLSLQE